MEISGAVAGLSLTASRGLASFALLGETSEPTDGGHFFTFHYLEASVAVIPID